MFTGQIRRGALRLDNHFGSREYWVNKIDLDTLDMKNGKRCILGQLFDGYFDGVDILFNYNQSPSKLARSHGYDSYDDDSSYARLTREYAQLTREWKEYLAQYPGVNMTESGYEQINTDNPIQFAINELNSKKKELYKQITDIDKAIEVLKAL